MVQNCGKLKQDCWDNIASIKNKNANGLQKKRGFIGSAGRFVSRGIEKRQTETDRDNLCHVRDLRYM